MARIIFQIVMAMALIVFLFYQFQIVKKTRALKKYFASVIFCFFALMLIKIIPFLISDINAYLPPQPFSSQIWLQSPEKRLSLVKDLINSQLLDDKTKKEVLAILGEPLTNSSYFKSNPDRLIYRLGKDHGLIKTTQKWLLIRLENGRVFQYQIEKR